MAEISVTVYPVGFNYQKGAQEGLEIALDILAQTFLKKQDFLFLPFI
jgi:hypothetical protein